MSTLKTLKIANLRGCTNTFSLAFEAGKKLTVLYGENGTGKSTVCDAFEFIGNGKIGSLEKRGLGQTGPYWASFGKNSQDISVTLETGEGSCTGKVGASEVMCSPSQLRPRVEVLRRARILDLIEAQPGDRYKAIERFIDVGGPEAAEGTLRELIKSLKQTQKIALARIAENQTTLEQSWAIGGKPGANFLSWAEAQSRIDVVAFETEARQIEALASALARLNDAVGAVEPAATGVDRAGQALAEAKKTLAETTVTAVADAGDVVAILEAARRYLQKHPAPETCPLCESESGVERLGERVDLRLNALNALRAAHAVVKPAESALTAAEARLAAARESVALRATEFETIRGKHQWPEDVPNPALAAPTNVENLAAWLATANPLVPRWGAAKDRRGDQQRFLATVKSALATYRQNLSELKDFEALLPKLGEALRIAEEERRVFTDEILSAIAVDVGKLYETVHPGEGLDKISLALDPKRRASLGIESSFAGRTGLPPQAYFSDSHLDTLGLCVFLALAKIEKPAETVLVLDDVFASVDEPHVERLIELLYGEASKFRHCLVTTHYRPWKHKWQWGWLKNGQVQFVELGKWSNLNGLYLIQTIPDVEKLRGLLTETPPDVQLVCAKAGYILEAALNFLTLQYECPCPRKPDGRFTLRDYIQAINKKLRDALRVEICQVDAHGTPIVILREIKLGPILHEIERIAEARNVLGCHYKEISFDLLEHDGTGFGQQVLALLDGLTDLDAGWPQKQMGDHWTTGDRTRRLYPLRRP